MNCKYLKENKMYYACIICDEKNICKVSYLPLTGSIKEEDIYMNEEIKNDKVEEINPVDEYLKNYKKQKLAEFCVQKDKQIKFYKKERQELMEQISNMKDKVEIWKNVNKLYDEIKKMSVDDFFKLYHKICDDITGNYTSTLKTNISSCNVTGIRID